MSNSIKFLQRDCDPELANDRTLPYTAYLVHYIDDDIKKYDLIIANRKVDIFDYYWDNYRKGFQWFKQSEGRVNPKLWTNVDTSKKKK